MQKSFIIFIFLMSATALANYECKIEGEITSCTDKDKYIDITSCSEADDKDNGLDEQFDEIPDIEFCQEDMLYGKTNKLSPKQMAKKEEKVRKECLKKAKKFKKSTAKKLIKKWNFGQALQVAFKRKKKIIENSHRNETQSFDFTQNIDPKEIEGMTKDQFSKYMMNQIRKEVPNIDKMVKESKRFKSYGYKKEEIMPINIAISSEGDKNCILKPKGFPKEDDFSPKACEECREKPKENYFTNDCAYMVTNDLSESKAREMMNQGKKSFNKNKINHQNNSGKDAYCNNDMKGVTNDSSELDNVVKNDLCHYANKNYTPEVTIESSRNLFSDYTDQLAQKRGQFTQKYLYEQLGKKCELSEGTKKPDWMTNFDKFKEVVQVKHPFYAREGNKEGDYGPNPVAQGQAAREKEKQYLKQTLLKEKEERLKKYNEDYEKVDKELSQIDTELKNTQKEYQAIKTALNKADIRDVKDMYIVMAELESKAQELIAKKKVQLQEKNDYETRIKNIKKGVASEEKYKMQDGEFLLVKKLDDYYKARDNGKLNQDKAEWKKYWNQFKIARVKSDFKKENSFGIDEELVTPELAAMLNTLVEVDTFTCILEPMKTFSTEGVFKGGLQVATAIATPVSYAAAGIGVGAATGSVWLYDLFCIGCDRPGRVIPKFKDVFKRRRGPRTPFRHRWRNFKKGWKDYVDWDGKLEIDKFIGMNDHYPKKGKATNFEQTLGQFQENASQSSCFNEQRTDEPNINNEQPTNKNPKHFFGRNE